MDRHDDPAIDGDMVLLRRIPPKADRVQWDESTGEPSPASQNFKDRNDELSVFLAAETTADAVLAGHDGFGLVQFTAGKAREVLGLGVILCRDSSDPAPGHMIICGKITNGMAKRLRGIASWVPGRWPTRVPSDV
jgi:hypothetical protein